MPYSANSCLPWYSRRSITRLVRLGESRGLLRLARVERLLKPPDDLGQRGAGGEHGSNTRLAQARDLVGGDDPAPEHEHVPHALLAQERDDAREQRVVRAREHRETDGVGVLLQRGLRHLLGRLVQPRVDDLEAGVAQGAGDDLRAPVVTVEAGLGDHDAVAPLHDMNPRMAPVTIASAPTGLRSDGNVHWGRAPGTERHSTPHRRRRGRRAGWRARGSRAVAG